MSYVEMRELARRLQAEADLASFEFFRSRLGIDDDARQLIARIEQLVAADTEEASVVVPELARWAVSLALAP